MHNVNQPCFKNGSAGIFKDHELIASVFNLTKGYFLFNKS